MGCRAYILIEATIGRAREVTQALKGLAGVTEAYLIMGSYEVVAIVEGADTNAVSDVVATGVHAIPGVARTTTCLAVNLP